MAGNRFGTWKKRTAAVFMAVCLLGAMPGAVWAADAADELESSISDSETRKQELEQKNEELNQALEEAKKNAEDQEALHQAYQDKIDALEKSLPGFDCGSCGSPTCRALAWDIAHGYANELNCIFKLNDRISNLASEMVALGASTRFNTLQDSARLAEMSEELSKDDD